MGLSQISVNEFVVRNPLIFQRLLACAKQSNLKSRMRRFCPENCLEKGLAMGFPSPLAGSIPLCVVWVTIRIESLRTKKDLAGFPSMIYSICVTEIPRHQEISYAHEKPPRGARKRLEGIMIPRQHNKSSGRAFRMSCAKRGRQGRLPPPGNTVRLREWTDAPQMRGRR
jgi:hypothetical protein